MSLKRSFVKNRWTCKSLCIGKISFEHNTKTFRKIDTHFIQWGLCTWRHGIQKSMEAILACHPARSTEWLDWVAKSCELWCICTGPLGKFVRVGLLLLMSIHAWQTQNVSMLRVSFMLVLCLQRCIPCHWSALQGVQSIYNIRLGHRSRFYVPLSFLAKSKSDFDMIQK